MPHFAARLIRQEDDSGLLVQIDQVLAYRDRIHHARCRAAAQRSLEALQCIGVAARVCGRLARPGRKLSYPAPIELCILAPAGPGLQEAVGRTVRDAAGGLGVRILWAEQLPRPLGGRLLPTLPPGQGGVPEDRGEVGQKSEQKSSNHKWEV